MRIAGVLSCSMINGSGVRYVIFCQGCGHHCEGCQNPDTWDFNGGKEITVEELASDIRRHQHIDGITLSGGDPFYQEEECVKLIKLLGLCTNVWVYTGFLYEEIRDRELSCLSDVIVDGPFERDKKVEGELYGSANQRIIEIMKNREEQVST